MKMKIMSAVLTTMSLTSGLMAAPLPSIEQAQNEALGADSSLRKAVSALKAAPQAAKPADGAETGAISVKDLLGSWTLESLTERTKDGQERSFQVKAGFGFRADGSFFGTDIYGKPRAGTWRIDGGKLILASADGSQQQGYGAARDGDKLDLTVFQPSGTVWTFVLVRSADSGAIMAEQLLGDWTLTEITVRTKDGKRSVIPVAGTLDLMADGTATSTRDDVKTGAKGRPEPGTWRIADGKLELISHGGTVDQIYDETVRTGDVLTLSGVETNGDVASFVFRLDRKP